MILLNSFYFIQTINLTENSISAKLKFKKDHPIYEGHFPEQPVTPGVCMIQMVKEITEKECHLKLLISKATEIKYLDMLIPDDENFSNLIINYNITTPKSISIIASLSTNEKVNFKFKAEMTII